MKKKSIWAHTLVKNEERYLWYAVMSVVDWVDKVLLWDSGSTDNTVEIIKKIKNLKGNKIDFRRIGPVDINEFTTTRQQMLDKTKADWFLIVDGDEVWWKNSIKQIVDTINKEGDRLETIVNPYCNIIGDIYHYQEEAAGQYRIDGHRGHINIRAVNTAIPGLHFQKPHGQQGLFDESGVLIQNRDRKFRKFINAPYLHFTNMIRSSSRSFDFRVPKRIIKFKYEIGIPFPKDFQYPEVFYREKPQIVPSPWIKMSPTYFIRAAGETILKKIKRKIIRTDKVGY